jgi:single-strand DNA-binding protein
MASEPSGLSAVELSRGPTARAIEHGYYTEAPNHVDDEKRLARRAQERNQEKEKQKMPSQTSKVGNLTRDPELAYSEKGTAYTRFGLAVTPYAGKGAPKPEPSFYDVVCFGSMAENVAESLHKGDRVVVTGKGESEEYEAKDGTKRTQKKILADGCGPDLRFATATVVKPKRAEAKQQAFGDDEEPF